MILGEVIEKIKSFADAIRATIRGSRGLPIEEPDSFSGMIDIKDIRERTRLNEMNVVGHSAMRLIAAWFPEEMGYWKEIADMEDHYFISQDGEGRKEAILSLQAKRQLEAPSAVTNITLPEVSTKPAEQPKKGGIFHRGQKE